ncbi:MAG TPA: ABC transporter substrate-binding protein [Candidatus Bathyarchaeia archaeon]|nr:ABC transporter substrate-binding protein [Candidatus Bathyarchaeia archaeon]
MRSLKALLVVLGALVALAPARSSAQDGTVKIGVLDDMSGPYSDNTGPGDLLAVRMAVADFGGSVLGKPIEVISADMQSKVDVGVAIARRWYEQDGVDLIIGIPHSAIALGVVKLAEQTNRLVMPTAAATSDLTGKACSAHSVHWVYDTYGQGKTLVNAIVKQGGDSWFFITVDYAFGHALEQNASDFVKAAGGKVLGSARHPLNNADFSSFLVQAQASKAKVVVMANGGADITNAIKQAKEFGLDRGGQRVAALLIQYPEVRAIGLPTAQGLFMASSFYWDMTPEARAFTDRFAAAKGMPPTMIQAGTYGATLHYLKAVKAAGTDEAKAVMARMKEMPIDDFMTKNGRIREDGRVIRDMYLMQVKTPEESKGEWDLAKIVATIPGEQAFRPLAEGGCPLVKR